MAESPEICVCVSAVGALGAVTNGDPVASRNPTVPPHPAVGPPFAWTARHARARARAGSSTDRSPRPRVGFRRVSGSLLVEGGQVARGHRNRKDYANEGRTRGEDDFRRRVATY